MTRVEAITPRTITGATPRRGIMDVAWITVAVGVIFWLAFITTKCLDLAPERHALSVGDNH